MNAYLWSGINNNGQKINGITQANNRQELKNKLAKQNITTLKINIKLLDYFCNPKIKSKDINALLEQLSLLINANIPIIKALIIIHKDLRHHKLKHLVSNIKQSISNGNSLHKTMQQYPKQFNKLVCGLVNAGEQSGNLDMTLIEITAHIKKTDLQKRKLIKTLIYPLTILLTTITVTTIFLLFIIPQFETMFDNFGAKLPFYTQIIINFSKLLQKTWKFDLNVLITLVLLVKLTTKGLSQAEFLKNNS